MVKKSRGSNARLSICVMFWSFMTIAAFTIGMIALVQSNSNITTIDIPSDNITGLIGFWYPYTDTSLKNDLMSWGKFDEISGKLIGGEIGYSIVGETRNPMTFHRGNESGVLIGIQDFYVDELLFLEYNTNTEVYNRIIITLPANHSDVYLAAFDALNNRYIFYGTLSVPFASAGVLTIFDRNTGIVSPFTGYNGAVTTADRSRGIIILDDTIVSFTSATNMRLDFFNRNTGQLEESSLFAGYFKRGTDTTSPSINGIYTTDIATLTYIGVSYDPSTFTLYVAVGNSGTPITDIGRIFATSDADMLVKLKQNNFEILLSTHQPARILKSLAWI